MPFALVMVNYQLPILEPQSQKSNIKNNIPCSLDTEGYQPVDIIICANAHVRWTSNRALNARAGGLSIICNAYQLPVITYVDILLMFEYYSKFQIHIKSFKYRGELRVLLVIDTGSGVLDDDCSNMSSPTLSLTSTSS